MEIIARSEGFFVRDLLEEAGAAARAPQGRDHALSIASSTGLHALAIALLVVLAPRYGTETAGKGLGLVPVQVELDWNRAPPAAPAQAALAPSGGGPEARPVTDPLATKLEALAKLHAPGSGAPSEGDSERAANMLPSSASSPGQKGMYGLKDFIVDQVERHWNLNLANLTDAPKYSVPIRVKITKSGEVLKAELIDNSHSGEPHYDEVAISARNAVLASSPLALPTGQYEEVTDMIIYMNPRDTLR